MPEGNEQKRIIVTDERVNEYGFRVLVSGIDWSDFDKNSIMGYNHLRTTDSYDRNRVLFPIGKWEDRQIEGGKVTYLPVFNEKYEYGALVKQMYEDGFLNTASIYIDIIEVSEDPALMLPGQKRATVTKSKVKEISITDIPGNAGCHKLAFNGHAVALSAEMNEEEISQILPEISKTKNSKKMNTKVFAKALGFDGEVDEAKLVAKITEIQNKNARLVAENEQLKKDQVETKVNSLVDAAISEGKITEGQKEVWLTLAKTDFDSAKLALDAMSSYEAPTLQIQKGDPNASASLVEKYDELDKLGKLGELQKSDPQQFKELRNAKVAAIRASGRVAQ